MGKILDIVGNIIGTIFKTPYYVTNNNLRLFTEGDVYDIYLVTLHALQSAYLPMRVVKPTAIYEIMGEPWTVVFNDVPMVQVSCLKSEEIAMTMQMLKKRCFTLEAELSKVTMEYFGLTHALRVVQAFDTGSHIVFHITYSGWIK